MDKLDEIMICVMRFISSSLRSFRVWWPIVTQESARKYFGSTPNFIFLSPELKSNRSYVDGVGRRGLRYALEKNPPLNTSKSRHEALRDRAAFLVVQ